MKLTLGGLEFSSKKKAKEHAKSILKSHSVGDILSEEDTKFFRDALLLRGDRGREKIGVGIEYIRVDKSFYGNHHFMIHRVDGTEEDFSYIKLFQAQTERAKTTRGFREAIFPDTPKKEAPGMEAHHDGIEFNDILNEFLAQKGLDISQVAVKHIGMTFQIEDPVLREEFREFHKQCAKYKIVPKEEHMKIHYPPKQICQEA